MADTEHTLDTWPVQSYESTYPDDPVAWCFREWNAIDRLQMAAAAITRPRALRSDAAEAVRARVGAGEQGAHVALQKARVAALLKPDDIVAFYMHTTTWNVMKQNVSHGQSLRSYLSAAFGVPVHIDDTLGFMVLEGAQRDGTRRRLFPEATNA